MFGECDNERKLKHIRDLNQGTRNHVMFVYANGLEMHSDADVDALKSGREKLMTDAQQLFAQLYQGAQGGAQAGPDMSGAQSQGPSDNQGGDDNVVDGDYREI